MEGLRLPIVILFMSLCLGEVRLCLSVVPSSSTRLEVLWGSCEGMCGVSEVLSVDKTTEDVVGNGKSDARNVELNSARGCSCVESCRTEGVCCIDYDERCATGVSGRPPQRRASVGTGDGVIGSAAAVEYARVSSRSVNRRLLSINSSQDIDADNSTDIFNATESVPTESVVQTEETASSSMLPGSTTPMLQSVTPNSSSSNNSHSSTQTPTTTVGPQQPTVGMTTLAEQITSSVSFVDSSGVSSPSPSVSMTTMNTSNTTGTGTLQMNTSTSSPSLLPTTTTDEENDTLSTIVPSNPRGTTLSTTSPTAPRGTMSSSMTSPPTAGGTMQSLATSPPTRTFPSSTTSPPTQGGTMQSPPTSPPTNPGGTTIPSSATTPSSQTSTNISATTTELNQTTPASNRSTDQPTFPTPSTVPAAQPPDAVDRQLLDGSISYIFVDSNVSFINTSRWMENFQSQLGLIWQSYLYHGETDEARLLQNSSTVEIVNRTPFLHNMSDEREGIEMAFYVRFNGTLVNNSQFPIVLNWVLPVRRMIQDRLRVTIHDVRPVSPELYREILGEEPTRPSSSSPSSTTTSLSPSSSPSSVIGTDTALPPLEMSSISSDLLAFELPLAIALFVLMLLVAVFMFVLRLRAKQRRVKYPSAKTRQRSSRRFMTETRTNGHHPHTSVYDNPDADVKTDYEDNPYPGPVLNMHRHSVTEGPMTPIVIVGPQGAAPAPVMPVAAPRSTRSSVVGRQSDAELPSSVEYLRVHQPNTTPL
eukprot:scpid23655/ scgid24667/ 